MERLYLKWKDVNHNIHTIATLYRYDGYYYLIINKEGIYEAKKNGCSGIGNINTNVPGYKSKELFTFFKSRILEKDDEHINKFLSEYELDEYDEMKILKKTKAYLGTDNYYVE